jgi:hypothetical protein
VDDYTEWTRISRLTGDDLGDIRGHGDVELGLVVVVLDMLVKVLAL